MKKKLLITLGCSYTEGIGCYDFSINPNKVSWESLDSNKKNITLNRFHELGWPNRVGKKLGFDKVINIGHRGTSNYSHISIFCESIFSNIDLLKKNYEILVIWMLTESTRFSFYSKNKIHTFLPASNKNGLEKGYNLDSVNFDFCPIREMKQNILLGEHFFNSIEIPIIITSWSPDFMKVYDIYKSKSYLSPTPFIVSTPPNIEEKSRNLFISPICGHPNEIGYEFIAESISMKIKKYHPKYYFGYQNDNIEWEWINYY